MNAFRNEACIVSGVEFNVRRIRSGFFNPRQCVTTSLCTSHCHLKNTHEQKRVTETSNATLGRLAAWPCPAARPPGRPAARPPARPPAQPLGRPTAQPPGSPAARSSGRPAARLHGRQAVVRPPGRPSGRSVARRLGRPPPARPRTATQRFLAFLGSDHRTACSEPLRSVAARTATQ